MPASAEATITTRRPRARCAAAIRRIFSQRGRVETLVPPNLTTTHGAFGASAGAVCWITMALAAAACEPGILSCVAAKRNGMAQRGPDAAGPRASSLVVPAKAGTQRLRQLE